MVMRKFPSKPVSKILAFDKWLEDHISDKSTDGWGLPIYRETEGEKTEKSDKVTDWKNTDWVKYFLLILTVLFICGTIYYVCGWQCLSVHIGASPLDKFF